MCRVQYACEGKIADYLRNTLFIGRSVRFLFRGGWVGHAAWFCPGKTVAYGGKVKVKQGEAGVVLVEQVRWFCMVQGLGIIIAMKQGGQPTFYLSGHIISRSIRFTGDRNVLE